MKKMTLTSQSFEPLLKKIEALDRTKRFTICLLTIAVILVAFIFLSVKPMWESINTLQAELESTDQKLMVAKDKASKLEALQNERKMKEMEFRKVMKALPEKKEIPSLLTSISQSGQDTGVEFALFEPKAEVAKEFYAEIPVEMEMSGGFHSTVMFFDKVTSLNRIVNIRNISMTMVPPSKDEEKVKLKTKCQAVTYKFIEPGEAQAADAKNVTKKPKTNPAPPSK